MQKESNIMTGCLVTKSSPTLVTPWTPTCQASLSASFMQEYWSGMPLPPVGICLTQGSKLCLCIALRVFTNWAIKEVMSWLASQKNRTWKLEQNTSFSSWWASAFFLSCLYPFLNQFHLLRLFPYPCSMHLCPWDASESQNSCELCGSRRRVDSRPSGFKGSDFHVNKPLQL